MPSIDIIDYWFEISYFEDQPNLGLKYFGDEDDEDDEDEDEDDEDEDDNEEEEESETEEKETEEESDEEPKGELNRLINNRKNELHSEV